MNKYIKRAWGVYRQEDIDKAIAEVRERCAKIAEDIERDRWEAVGDPRIPALSQE